MTIDQLPNFPIPVGATADDGITIYKRDVFDGTEDLTAAEARKLAAALLDAADALDALTRAPGTGPL